MRTIILLIMLSVSAIYSQNVNDIDTVFYNGKIKLAGTLSIPDNIKNPPCVILLTGSGRQTRDENIYGFKIFKIIADSLSRSGIAVFRFDDRGAGGSDIGETTATTADYAEDALAAVDFIKSFSKFDKIGLLGHSGGGMASIIAASSNDDVQFVILMAGPVISGGDVTLWQIKKLLKVKKVSRQDYMRKVALEKKIIQNVREGKNPETLYEPIFNEALKSYPELPENMRGRIKNDTLYAKLFASQTISSLNNPWTKFFFSYSPEDDLEQINVPILALYGSKDMQVPARIDSATLAQAAKVSGNTNVKIIVFPSANHLFQKAGSGLPEEYPNLPKKFIPGFLDSIKIWIKSLN